MGRYRKKPVIVEACQFRLGELGIRGACVCWMSDRPHVHTMHDDQTVDLTDGDWIIAEPDGEHYYPVKASVFPKTYEAACDE